MKKKRKKKFRYLIKRNKRIALNRFNRSLTYKWKRKNKNRNKLYKSKAVLAKENIVGDFNLLKAPNIFSFTKSPYDTILFINGLANLKLKKKKVFVDLSDVEKLDYSAVTVLLSVMFSFKAEKIKFNGNFPLNLELKQTLIDSGFFKYLAQPIGEKIEYTIGNPNQIFTRANKLVNSELGLIVMEEASTTIWGEKRVCKGLQRVLLELMQNTNNHADTDGKGLKHWWLSRAVLF